ncbi:uncharacterized protein VTP21DRAFT_5990 [Calcarisporiella thermophila]|uniref:uncharacterized protein n=1 Tax=Calcarisporiella thermophila TaxID=911321 RepID=UPI0037443DDD
MEKQKEHGRLYKFLKWRERDKVETPKISYVKLYRYASKVDIFLILLGTLFSIAAGMLRPMISIPYGKVITGFDPMTDPDTNRQNIIEAVKILLGFGLALVVFSYGSMCCWTLAGEYQTRRIRELYFRAILQQDQSWFDLTESESLNTRLSSDTFLIQEGISDKVGLVIKNVTQVISGFTMAFIFGWRLSLVLLALLPLILLSGYLFTGVIKSQTLKTQNAYSSAGSFVEQAISGIRTVATFGLQSQFINYYNENLKVAYQAGTHKAIKIVSKGSMSSAEVVQAFFSFIIGTMSISEIGPEYKALVEAQVAAYKIFETIDRTPVIVSSKRQQGNIQQKHCRGEITLCEVHFRYPSRPDVPVLSGVDFQIPSGKTVALVGASGSGKSTIIQLVQRFYDPTAGKILLDGVDLRDIDIKWLRNQIGLVGQEPVLFDDTIRNNIALGALNRNPTQAEIEEVCIQANCHNMINSLPKGYDTKVGEIGSQFSGGQKQRIAIARALIRNPAILLLDEATSALDTRSEKIVQEALKSASRNRTTIIIAHRLSTIRDADLIMVMENGKIIEQGSHTELLAKKGAYLSYVQKQQLKAYEDKKDNLDSDSILEKTREMQSDWKPSLETRLTCFKTYPSSLNVEIKREKRPVLRVLHMMSPEWKYILMSLFGAVIKGAVLPLDGLLFGRAFNALSQPPDRVEQETRFWSLMYFAMALCSGFDLKRFKTLCVKKYLSSISQHIPQELSLPVWLKTPQSYKIYLMLFLSMEEERYPLGLWV